MQSFRVVSLGLLFLVAMPAYAVDFWHSSTTWINHGQCSAEFTFDGGGWEEIQNLRVSVTAINQAGKKVASGVLEIEQFGNSSADRYAKAFIEGEELCEEKLAIVVNKATAIIDGKRIDLMKTKSLTSRDFKPFKIQVGN